MRCPIIVICFLFGAVTAVWGEEAEAASEDERLIGWQGETFTSDKKVDAQPGPERKRWIETVAWRPRAFVYHGFLTPEECDHLVARGTKRVTQSTVVDSKTGNSVLDPVRTSYGAFFGRGEDAVIASVEERIAEWTHLPADCGEHMQILRYVDGQKYDAHWDWFDKVEYFGHEGNRVATVLMYLAEVEEGGETYLPLADRLDEEAQAPRNASACIRDQGVYITPAKGDALLFWDMNPGTDKGERRALHASCPTLKGTKWTATKWLHGRAFMGGFDALKVASQCDDTALGCAKMVKDGLCYKNSSLMVGPAGQCRRACGDCIVCPADDVLCQRRNMRGMFDAHRAKLLAT